MSRVGGRRLVVVALVFLVLGSTVVGTGVATVSTVQSSPDSGPDRAVSDRGEPDRFAADTVGPSAPSPQTTSTVTESGGSASAVATDDVFERASANITATQEYRLTPDERGRITVVQRYQVPDRVASLKPQLPSDVTVTGTTGFSQGEGTTYEWDGNTSAPQIVFTMTVNETRDLSGPEGARGQYLFVDAGDWALFRQPSIGTSWSWRGSEPVGITRETTTEGPGYAGDWMVYLGEVRTHERTAHGQRFELVVPRRASLAESPAAVLDSMAAAADQLRVGDRDDEVHAFAAPTTTSVQWGVRGLQLGDRDMWVRDLESLSTAENTWLHEYVHTRQDYDTTASAKWTVEAFATYYAAHLAMEQDLTEFDGLREVLRRGTAQPQSDAVLTDPSTWTNAANYLKGSLVAADVDRRIRLATGQSRSLQAVFSRLNAHQEPVGERAVFESVGTVADSGVRRAAVTYAGTERTPELWSQADHAEAFGSTPARVETGFADGSNAFAVGGPFRNESLDRSTPTLYAGETLTVVGAVSNTGEAASEYEARFAVDGRVLATESGTIQPGERVTHRFNRTFEQAGERTVAVGGDEVTVAVHEPGPTNVSALSANRTQLADAGAVEITATVTNPNDIPARGSVRLGGPDGPIIDRQVALSAGENRTVSGVVRLSRGTYEFSIGEADTLTVTVGGTGSDADGGSDGSEGASQDGAGGQADGGSSGFGPGFGPVATLLAVVAGLALLGRRRA